MHFILTQAVMFIQRRETRIDCFGEIIASQIDCRVTQNKNKSDSAEASKLESHYTIQYMYAHFSTHFIVKYTRIDFMTLLLFYFLCVKWNLLFDIANGHWLINCHSNSLYSGIFRSCIFFYIWSFVAVGAVVKVVICLDRSTKHRLNLNQLTALCFVHQHDYHWNSNQTAKINLSTALISWVVLFQKLVFGNQWTNDRTFRISKRRVENLCVKHMMLIRIQMSFVLLLYIYMVLETQFILWNYRFSDWKRALNGMLPLKEWHFNVMCQWLFRVENVYRKHDSHFDFITKKNFINRFLYFADSMNTKIKIHLLKHITHAKYSQSNLEMSNLDHSQKCISSEWINRKKFVSNSGK